MRLAAAALLVFAACSDAAPDAVIVDAVPAGARNCAVPPDGLSIDVSVDPPGVERWPDVPCRGDRARVRCDRDLGGGLTITTDFQLAGGVVLISYSDPGACALEYAIADLSWH